METQESRVRRLIAYDMLDIPLNALHKRIDRQHKNLAVELGEMYDQGTDFGSAQVSVEYENHQRARAMREAIDEFCAENPVLGRSLQMKIETKRTMRETYLCYGLPDDSRISKQDYLGVMEDIGLSASQAENLYPRLLETSYSLQKVRGKSTTHEGLRKVLIGKSEE